MQSLLTRGSSLAARRLTAMRSNTAVRGFAKQIKFGTEGRAAMLRGVDVLADAVQVRNSEFLKFCVFSICTIFITVKLRNLELYLSMLERLRLRV